MEFIHNSYNPGVTEMYIFIPLVILTIIVLYIMAKKEMK